MTYRRISLNIHGIRRKLSKFAFQMKSLAEDFSIIHKDDPKQALRLRRFFISFASYLVNLSLSYLAYKAGFMSLKALYGNLAIILVINVFLYVVFRLDLNTRLKDPSMTSLQICLASLVVMYAIFFVYEARSILFSLYILILLFGTFRLKTRQFFNVSAFILATYGIDIVLLKIFHPKEIILQIEIFQWLALAVVLATVSFIGGNISALRHDLATSRKKLQASLLKINEMAIHDDLTGFFNRRHLMEFLETEHNRSARSGAVFTLAMIDLDKFKTINDTFGHQVGDKILVTFSKIMRDILRKSDFCGRYGGEEFLVVLTQTDLQHAKIFAERIRSRIEESFFPELNDKLRVTVSIGLAQHEPHEHIDKTISRADEALYRAKKNGRNRVEVSPHKAAHNHTRL